MSEPSPAFGIAPKSNGREKPRWSVVRPKAEPASTTGLSLDGASVWVGPPLEASPPSSGSAVSGEPVTVPWSRAALSADQVELANEGLGAPEFVWVSSRIDGL